MAIPFFTYSLVVIFYSLVIEFFLQYLSAKIRYKVKICYENLFRRFISYLDKGGVWTIPLNVGYIASHTHNYLKLNGIDLI